MKKLILVLLALFYIANILSANNADKIVISAPAFCDRGLFRRRLGLLGLPKPLNGYDCLQIQIYNQDVCINNCQETIDMTEFSRLSGAIDSPVPLSIINKFESASVRRMELLQRLERFKFRAAWLEKVFYLANLKKIESSSQKRETRSSVNKKPRK